MAGYGGNVLAISEESRISNIITRRAMLFTVIFADEVGELKQNASKGAQQLKVTNAEHI